MPCSWWFHWGFCKWQNMLFNLVALYLSMPQCIANLAITATAHPAITARANPAITATAHLAITARANLAISATANLAITAMRQALCCHLPVIRCQLGRVVDDSVGNCQPTLLPSVDEHFIVSLHTLGFLLLRAHKPGKWSKVWVSVFNIIYSVIEEAALTRWLAHLTADPVASV